VRVCALEREDSPILYVQRDMRRRMSNENEDIVHKVNEYRESLKECLEGTTLIDKPKLIRLLQTLYRIDISRTLLEVTL
jgi:hypothetical protein